MMKKTSTILLSLVMILGLAGCGNSASQLAQPSTQKKTVESAAGIEKTTENSSANVESTEVPESKLEKTNASGTQENKILVAYFSATNTTEGVAEHIANGLNADIYEIVPEDPYTDADLNYNDNSSRTTIEMKDPDARPAISDSVEDMEQYTIIFIGYAILNEKFRECAEKHISMKVEGIIYAPLLISDYDICTILVNAMDNAVEACERVSVAKKWITVSIGMYQEYLHLIISNSSVENVELKTQKADKRNHGLGLENLQESVEKNQGKVSMVAEGGKFALDILVKGFEEENA